MASSKSASSPQLETVFQRRKMNPFRGSRVARNPRMTLTVVLFLGVLSAGVASPPAVAATQGSTQSPSASAPANSPSQQDASSSAAPPPQTSAPQNPTPENTPTTSPAQPSTPSTAQAPAEQKHSQSAHPLRRRKKPGSSDCTSAAVASGTSSAATPSSASAAQAKGSSGGNSGTPLAPTNCPPPKVIVRQGGARETSIQLAGGAGGDQAAQQRDTANQMLGTAEENLKKMEGRHLTTSQRDLVSQIHQFIDESRSAVKAGELDRARTLAWKAQTLSQELVKPENQ